MGSTNGGSAFAAISRERTLARTHGVHGECYLAISGPALPANVRYTMMQARGFSSPQILADD